MPIDRQPDVVDEGGGEQFLVIGALTLDEIEDLQRVLERVAFGMAGGILADRLEHRHERGDAVEAVAGHVGQAARGVDRAEHLPSYLARVGQPIGLDPAAGHPPCGPKRRPTGVGTAAHLAGRGGRDALPELVGGTGVARGLRHGVLVSAAAGSFRKRMFFASPTVE